MILAGRTALITGASSGLGAAFAQELARRKVNLVLVACSEKTLIETDNRLHREYGVRVDVIVQDLALEGAASALCHRLDELGVRVNLLVNNAGFATQGRFETIPADQDHRQVMLNVATVVDLTHALLPAMLADGTGGIINVASLGGFQPAPYLAVYAATKAFMLSFSQALSAELHGRGGHRASRAAGFSTVATGHVGLGRQGRRSKSAIVPPSTRSRTAGSAVTCSTMVRATSGLP